MKQYELLLCVLLAVFQLVKIVARADLEVSHVWQRLLLHLIE